MGKSPYPTGRTYHAARRPRGFSLAVQLIPETLDVIQPVGNDDHPLSQGALDG